MQRFSIQNTESRSISREGDPEHEILPLVPTQHSVNQVQLSPKANPQTCDEELTPESIEKVLPGDILYLKGQKSQSLVVECVRKSADEYYITGIHYGQKKGFKNYVIIKEEFKFNKKDAHSLEPKCFLQEFESSLCYPPDVVLQRARSRLNEREYNSKTNNAYQFALWCKTVDPGHRVNNLVPIFLPNSTYIHEVKVGDHLDFSCDGGKTLHGIVTESIGLAESKSLLKLNIRASDLRSKDISFVHTKIHSLKNEVLVVRSTPKCINSDVLASRVELLNTMTFRNSSSSFAFCKYLTDPNQSEVEWKALVGENLPTDDRNPLCERIMPKLLKVGDIIYFEQKYSVVTQVRSLINSVLEAETVQIGVPSRLDSNECISIKLVISMHETHAMLCVHNNSASDCTLLTDNQIWSNLLREVQVTPENLSDIKSGDLLRLPYFNRNHMVVVEDVTHKEDNCEISTIHYGRPWFVPNRIIREKFCFKIVRFTKGYRVEPECTICYPIDASCYSPDIVIKRAQSRLNEQEYWLTSNRSFHFALWCKTKSSSHRPNCKVPIYVTDDHPVHKVDVGDHLDFSCDGGKTLHGIVTESIGLAESKSLLKLNVSASDLRSKDISFVHTKIHSLKNEVQVVRSTPKCINSDVLASRVELLNTMTFRNSSSSFAFCKYLTDPNQSEIEWKALVGENLPTDKRNPLCEGIMPKLLKVGDIIYFEQKYSVVTQVRSLINSVLEAETVQIGVPSRLDSKECISIKLVISMHETHAMLCVHNNSASDCPLLTDNQFWANLLREVHVKVTPENLSDIKSGDLLRLPYFNLNHMVVVEDATHKEDSCEISAIHYGRQNLFKCNRIIREKFCFKIVRFPKGYRVEPECTICYPIDASCYSPDIVIKRAQSRLNEQEYWLTSNRSFHFALWCKTKSSSHRPNCKVPIYVTDDHHVHKVDVGDHLDIKCDGGKTLHGIVIELVAVTESKILVQLNVSAGDLRAKKVAFVHTKVQKLSEDVLVVKSTPKCVDSNEFASRVEMLDTMTFSKRNSSLALCKYLTDPNPSQALAGENLLYDAERPLCLKVHPESLKPGDIIYIDGTYSVLLNLQRNDNIYEINTIQYGPIPDSIEDVHNIKFLISRKETETVLCVHNDAERNCPLNVGKAGKPDYNAEKITSMSQITRGCVISMRNILYHHYVVISDPDEHQGTVDVISYQRSWLSFEIKTFNMKLSTNSKNIYLIKYKVPSTCQFTPDETMTRAKSRLGEKEHNWQWNSDRDFARWCSIQHPSNREQCCIPVNSTDELLQFQSGHIKFLKCPDLLYTHDAILRSCSVIDEVCKDILRVRIYENNHVFKTIRTEELRLGNHDRIRRICYSDGCGNFDNRDWDELMNCAILCSNEDRKGYLSFTNKEKTILGGKRIESGDFCFWLKTVWSLEGLRGISKMFDEKLRMKKAEEEVELRELKKFDHIILSRQVNGKITKVHYVLSDWNEESGIGTGVTYEMPVNKEGMGFRELNGFLKVTGPGDIMKVVHSLPFNWDLIDRRFRGCQGIQDYNLFRNNCEHFVNFLIYGRHTSLQIQRKVGWTVNYPMRGVRSVIMTVIRFVRAFINGPLGELVSVLPDFGTLTAEICGGVFIILVAVVSIAWLMKRQVNTCMPQHEFNQRLFNILSMAGFALTGIVGIFFLGPEIFGAIFGALAIGAAAFGAGFAVPRLVPIVKALLKP